MNRIRKYNGGFQVLITPNIKISPDASLMLGNWEGEELNLKATEQVNNKGNSKQKSTNKSSSNKDINKYIATLIFIFIAFSARPAYGLSDRADSFASQSANGLPAPERKPCHTNTTRFGNDHLPHNFPTVRIDAHPEIACRSD